MNKARLTLRTSNGRLSLSLIQAVEPDNFASGLRIHGKQTSKGAQFRIEQNGKVETFISTLDDLLACLQAAKSTLSRVEAKTE